MPMIVVNLLKYFHLLTVMLAFGGAITQMIALCVPQFSPEFFLTLSRMLLF